MFEKPESSKEQWRALSLRILAMGQMLNLAQYELNGREPRGREVRQEVDVKWSRGESWIMSLRY